MDKDVHAGVVPPREYNPRLYSRFHHAEKWAENSLLSDYETTFRCMNPDELCLHPYAFFGLDPQTATLAQLRQAYYNLARHCHPDRGGQPEDMRRVHATYRWVAAQLQTVEGRVADTFVPVVTEHVPRWGALVWDVAPVSQETVAAWMGGPEVLEELRPFVEALLDQRMQNVADGLDEGIPPEPFREMAQRFRERGGSAPPLPAIEGSSTSHRALSLYEAHGVSADAPLGSCDYHEAFQEPEDLHALEAHFEAAAKNFPLEEALQRLHVQRAESVCPRSLLYKDCAPSEGLTMQSFASYPVPSETGCVYVKVAIEDVRPMDLAGPWRWDAREGDARSETTGVLLRAFLSSRA